MNFDTSLLKEFNSFIQKYAAQFSANPTDTSPQASSLVHPQVTTGTTLPRETHAPPPVNNSTSSEIQNPSDGPSGGGPKPVTAPKQPLNMSGSFVKNSK
jgi:hypothetical protein